VGVDEAHRGIAEQRSGVALFLQGLVVEIPVEHLVLLVGEVVDFTDQRAVLEVEAALAGPELAVAVPQVPLADDGCLVAGFLEGLRQQPLLGVQTMRLARQDHHGLQAVAEGVAPGHQGGTRGRAHRLGVELVQLCAGLCKLVDVRGADVGAMEADVLPAQVVRDDVDDVGTVCRGDGLAQAREQGEQGPGQSKHQAMGGREGRRFVG
jgi:hypothetical protein